MQRLSNIKKPTFILCSDIHLREDQPVCRTDDFWNTLWNKIRFISDLQKKFDCPVLHGGDLFHQWKPSPLLLTFASRYLPKKFFSIAGQHDLPNHSFELMEKSGINTLATTNVLTLLPRVHYGFKPEDFHYEKDAGIEDWVGVKDRKILVWHKMAYQTPPYPGATGGNAKQLLQKYSSYDLLLTGDNHQSFVEEYEGRILVNPGSLTRQTAAQIDHKPRVYLYYAETNTVEPIYLPIEDVISREHIEVREERDSRLEAFIEHLNEDWDTTLSFEDNLKAFKDANEISEEVMNIIYKAINV